MATRSSRPILLNRNLEDPEKLRAPVGHYGDGEIDTPIRDRKFEPDIPSSAEVTAEIAAALAAYVGPSITAALAALWVGNPGDVWTQGAPGVASMVAQPKIYRALVTQAGTSAPTATVLANTLSGTPVLSYNDVGEYRITLASAFPLGKVFARIGATGPPYEQSGSEFFIGRATSNYINIYNYIAGAKANDLLTLCPVEIIVYP